VTRVTTVQLVDLPVARYLQMQQHHDAMLREFAIIAVGVEDPDVHAVPRRLVELVDEMHGIGDRSIRFRSAVHEAFERGDETTTITMEVGPETMRWAEDFLMLFDLGDEFCRSGQLLTSPSPPSVVAVRHWVVGELIRQVRDKAPPSPFQE
jgi:hypothetical protein